MTPLSGPTTPLSPSVHASGIISMAGFDRYYDSWRDRFRVSYPDHNDGTHILVQGVLSMIDS